MENRKTFQLPNTQFALLSKSKARLIMVAVILLCAAGVWVTYSPLKSGFANSASRGANDIDLYRAVVQRVSQGEAYYPSVKKELIARGYPTHSIFNWRTPLPMWMIAKLPSPMWGKAILGILAVVLLLLVYEALARHDGPLVAFFAGLLLTGPLMLCFLGDIYMMPTVWAGVFVAMSLCCYSIGRTGWAIAIGVTAMFMRDLMLPFGVAMLAYTVWQRRWKEVQLWSVGLIFYGAFFMLHIFQVIQWQPTSIDASGGNWFQFGGAGFLISLAQINAYLLLLPQWITAIYLVLGFIGFASWRTHWGIPLVLVFSMYVVIFSMVGYSYNQYWGSLISPLLCIGVALSPAALRDLWRAAEIHLITAKPKTA